MKTIAISFFRAFIIIGAIAFGIQATMLPKAKVVNVKTSAICSSCKKRIEAAVKSETGVVEAILNLNSKQLKVKYDSDKTSPEKIRTRISATGYNADDVKANPDAYHKLPACCQKAGVCND